MKKICWLKYVVIQIAKPARMWSVQRRKERKERKQEILLLIQHMALKCDKFSVNCHFLGQAESLGWVLFAHLVGDLLLPFNTYSRMHFKKCNSFPSAVLTDFIALSSTCIFQRKAVACNLFRSVCLGLFSLLRLGQHRHPEIISPFVAFGIFKAYLLIKEKQCQMFLLPNKPDSNSCCGKIITCLGMECICVGAGAHSLLVHRTHECLCMLILASFAPLSLFMQC